MGVLRDSEEEEKDATSSGDDRKMKSPQCRGRMRM
jgi:hypothetical protein